MAEINDPSGLDAVPGKLPPMRREEVIARAQRILDLRGLPPYEERNGYNEDGKGPGGYHTKYLSEDEAAVLSEFVTYWLPFLVQKETRITYGTSTAETPEQKALEDAALERSMRKLP